MTGQQEAGREETGRHETGHDAAGRWYRIAAEDAVASPAVLVYPERIEENIRRMVRAAGGVERLRPHVKTHKMPQVVRLQLAQGIAKWGHPAPTLCKNFTTSKWPYLLASFIA
jgi:D-serine deaminase-like pyridoxal phosphate-dependent protein